MYAKLKLSPSPQCSCGLEEQTAEHILQRCPLLEQKRQSTWPVDTTLENKSYGKMEENKSYGKMEEEDSVLHCCGRGDGVDGERQ